jgi:hypothetical protein
MLNSVSMKVLALAALAALSFAGTVSGADLTAQQDHQRLLDLLHIQSLRNGADGRNPNAPNAANYDETQERAPGYIK